MDYWQIVYTGLSIAGGFFAAKVWPVLIARWQQQEKRQAAQQQEKQEHQQRQDELTTSYHLSVGTEAHRMMGDLLSTSQEDKRLADDFIRKDIKKDLEAIASTLGNLAIEVNILIETEKNRAKLFTLQNGILSDMSHDLRSQQTKITTLIDLLKNE